jgi:tetratricopeptide (TPR) repeat protein
MLVDRDEEALPAAQSALRLQPNSAVVNLEVGFLMFRLKRHAEAQRLLLRSIELDAKQPKPRYVLGLSLLSTGQVALGEAQLLEALALDPSHVDARHELGRLYLSQKRIDAAIEQLSAASTLAPHRDDIRASLKRAGQR